jgi:hypothetical protein
MKSLLFLHTSPAHIATFTNLVANHAPHIEAMHLVDESLLQEAREQGITPVLRERVYQTIQNAGTAETAVIVCTCSTIGGVAEQFSTTERPILRVDRAMAEQAVALGNHILLVAALASTLEPTRHLMQEVAEQAGQPIHVTELLCADAWPYFEQGDLVGYHSAIAEQIRNHGASVDVIVLAQASMAGAAELCTDITIPMLSSPRLGVEAALKMVTGEAD